MGKTISIAEESAKNNVNPYHSQSRGPNHPLSKNPSFSRSNSASGSTLNATCTPSTTTTRNPMSRSSSYRSMSQLTNSSIISQQSSTTSISHRFVSYNDDHDALIRIQPNNNHNRSQSWHFKLADKTAMMNTQCTPFTSPLSPPPPPPSSPDHDATSNDNDDDDDDEPRTDYVVFGICDASLLELGHKHKYYGYGYCVTYCHGFKFESYSDAFPVDTEIEIKYEANKRQLTFWCNGQRKSRIIYIPNHSSHEYVVTVKAYCEQCEIQMI